MAFERFNRLVMCMNWCRDCNAKLIDICDEGFYYSKADGEKCYMKYEDM